MAEHDHLMRTSCDLEIVVPAFNEETRLPVTLIELADQLELIDGLHSRIVIVDNGCTDRTAELVDRFATTSRVDTVVIGCSTRGKGAAVRRGIRTGRSSFVGFLDADSAVPAAMIRHALDRLLGGSEVVIGSRRCAGASYQVRQPPVRRAGGWAFRRAIHGLAPGIRDTQCGFKFFSRDAAEQIFAEQSTTGFAFDVELLMRAHDLGYPVSELPVDWSDQVASTLRVSSHGPQIAREIVRLRRSAQLRRLQPVGVRPPVGARPPVRVLAEVA
jgi:dolichyl-phosphate beta-glucosyltransferase